MHEKLWFIEQVGKLPENESKIVISVNKKVKKKKKNLKKIAISWKIKNDHIILYKI